MATQGQVVLLRVGIDKGSGGTLGPIFADTRFEFVPICADGDCLGRTYGGIMGRYRRKLIEYFPIGMQYKMKDAFLHADPEFETFTYGDPTGPKQSLMNLRPGDLLVFYAGLQGWGECDTPAGLYIVGYFVVEHAGTYTGLKKLGQLRQFSKNWHVLNGDVNGKMIGTGKQRWIDLILVKGGSGSRLLRSAVRISAHKRAKDRGGHPVFVLEPELYRHFGTFTNLNAIQRSIPRSVKPEFRKKAADFVLNLN